MVIKCLCFDGVKKTVKIVRFVLESCTFRFRDYIIRPYLYLYDYL